MRVQVSEACYGQDGQMEVRAHLVEPIGARPRLVGIMLGEAAPIETALGLPGASLSYTPPFEQTAEVVKDMCSREGLADVDWLNGVATLALIRHCTMLPHMDSRHARRPGTVRTEAVARYVCLVPEGKRHVKATPIAGKLPLSNKNDSMVKISVQGHTVKRPVASPPLTVREAFGATSLVVAEAMPLAETVRQATFVVLHHYPDSDMPMGLGRRVEHIYQPPAA